MSFPIKNSPVNPQPQITGLFFVYFATSGIAIFKSTHIHVQAIIVKFRYWSQ